ncbi:hypothetical protein Alches_28610 [Alicyclobacillus hesperidum subsp. aegles]|nr:hypothetical protein Alches_28610 [Alicyclobacillus hesperidum subsp. aegles]
MRERIWLNDEFLKGLFLQDSGVAKLVERVLNQVLQAQMAEQLKAEPYERSAERRGHRNGTNPSYLDNQNRSTCSTRAPDSQR